MTNIKNWSTKRLKAERRKDRNCQDIKDELNRRATAKQGWSKWMVEPEPLILGPGMVRIFLGEDNMPCMPKFGPIRPGRG